jgi:hypothetical protein
MTQHQLHIIRGAGFKSTLLSFALLTKLCENAVDMISRHASS